MVSDGKIPPEGTEYGSPRTSPADESFSDMSRHLHVAREHASRYVSAQLDRIKAAARSAILFGLLGLAGAGIGIAIVVTSAVLLCLGIAGGIAELLGGRQWAGDLIAGGTVLGVIAIGGSVAVKGIVGIARRRTMASYEQRKTRDSNL
jgi:hypothetical protein